jgi:AmmeMemoRadiSam system protein B
MRARRPVVAGSFYAGNAADLRRQLEWCYVHELGPGAVPLVEEHGPREIVVAIAPHAGYLASGPVAAYVYRELALDGVFDTAIIVGPNHTGYGPPVSLWVERPWETPLGEVEIDKVLAQGLLGGVIEADETAHMHEHSIEVQLPWLQHLYQGVKIVPIAMLAQGLETAREVGRAISRCPGNVVVIASTDFTHYEPHRVAMAKDNSVIEAIVDLSEEEMYARLGSLGCTMCGYGPAASAIVAARAAGANRVSLLKYGTSGETTGDFSQVVGYGSIVMRR